MKAALRKEEWPTQPDQLNISQGNFRTRAKHQHTYKTSVSTRFKQIALVVGESRGFGGDVWGGVGSRRRKEEKKRKNGKGIYSEGSEGKI